MRRFRLKDHVQRLVGCLMLLAACTPGGLVAQQFSAELKVGLSGTTLRGDTSAEFDPIARLAGGGALRYTWLNNFAVQTEVLYYIKGASGDSEIGGVPIRATFDLTYLEIPILALYRFDTPGRLQPVFYAGPAMAFKLDARVSFRAKSGGPEFQEEDDTVRSQDLGLIFGTGVEFDVGGERLTVGLRATMGLSNAREAEPALHNTALTLLFGVLF